MRYSRELDGWNGADFEISRSDVEKLTNDLPRDLREALELGRDHTAAYARMQREHMRDFSGEISPGLEVGMRYIPLPVLAPIYLLGVSQSWPVHS